MEEMESETSRLFRLAFVKKRAELDAKVDPMTATSDEEFSKNLSQAREHAKALHPSSQRAKGIETAIASIKKKRTELAEAERKLHVMLDKPPMKKAKKAGLDVD